VMKGDGVKDSVIRMFVGCFSLLFRLERVRRLSLSLCCPFVEFVMPAPPFKFD
jgi:hypothetical protein